MQTLKPRLNVVGASARAACQSAVRAGFLPAACDLFGDEDLRLAATFHPLAGRFPGGLEGALDAMPPAPFIYTGGMENHAGLVDRLATLRPLWGNRGDALRRARDPMAVARALREAGASPPEVRDEADPPPDPRGWLWKPRDGAGGSGIENAAERPRPPRARARGYFQRRAAGLSCAAVYCAGAAATVLVGATRQLVGEAWLNAQPFAWCGNVGPLALSPAAAGVLRRCGESAAAAFGLRGLFGVDFLLEGEVVHPVEVNPRYPASAEVFDWAHGASLIALHAAAFGADTSADLPAASAAEVFGKAVLYAERGVRVVADLAAPFDPFVQPSVADVPPRGAVIAAGRPVITVCARAFDIASCVESLQRARDRVCRALEPAGAEEARARRGIFPSRSPSTTMAKAPGEGDPA